MTYYPEIDGPLAWNYSRVAWFREVVERMEGDVEKKTGKNYRKDRTCSQCGAQISDYSKTGLCLRCNVKIQQKKCNDNRARIVTIQLPAETIAAIPETITPPVETMPIPDEIKETLDLADRVIQDSAQNVSLGSAKLAIDRAFQDAERFENVKDLLSELKSVIARIEQVTA